MKLTKIKHLFILILFLQSCGSNSDVKNIRYCPLQAPYDYFDQIDNTSFHFANLDYRLNSAKGKNQTDMVNAVTKEFETTHNECLKKLDEKFPSGSVKIPFEQTGEKDSVTVKSIYISGFGFPWETATTISYYFTVEYEILKKDIWFVPIPLKFVDLDGDIIYICDVPANTSGKSRFAVKTLQDFKIFTKILIN